MSGLSFPGAELQVGRSQVSISNHGILNTVHKIQVLTDQTLITSPGIKAYKGDVVKQKKLFPVHAAQNLKVLGNACV